MSITFPPYHQMAGNRRFETAVQKLIAANTISADTLSAYHRYHFSLFHKLRSAYYHVTTLSDYLANPQASTLPHADLVYRVNYHFDGYLYAAGSAADIFAHEMLSYFAIPLPDRVYFNTAHARILASRAGDPILDLIAVPTWDEEFRGYRNTATHISIVGSQFSIEVVMKGNDPQSRVVFKLPDDPFDPSSPCRRNPNLVDYCDTTFKRLLRLLNPVYDHLATRVEAAQCLPL